MKKLLIILMCVFNVNVAFADGSFLELHELGVQIGLRYYFPQEADDLLYVYRDMLAENDNKGISPENMWEICTAAGLDIKQTEDKRKCSEFTQSLANLAKGFNPCNDRQVKNIPSGITARCEKNLFKNSSRDSNISFRLAEAFAERQTGKKIAYCLEYLDNMMLCLSADGREVYNFVFSKANKHYFAQDAYDICKVFGGTMPNYNPKTQLQICEGIDCSEQSPVYVFAYQTGGSSVGIGQMENNKCMIRVEESSAESSVCFPTYGGVFRRVVSLPDSAFRSLESLEKSIEKLYFNNWCFGIPVKQFGITGLKCKKPVETDIAFAKTLESSPEEAVMSCSIMGGGAMTIYFTPPDNYSYETSSLEVGSPAAPVVDNTIEVPDLVTEVKDVPLNFESDEPLSVEYMPPAAPVVDNTIEVPDLVTEVEDVPLNFESDEPLSVEYMPPAAPVVDNTIEVPDLNTEVEDVPLNFESDEPLSVEYMPSAAPVPIATVVPKTVPVDRAPKESGEPVTPYQVEKPNNTGLIATAAILGAIGTGVLVGALVGGDDDDDDDTHGEEYNQLEQDLTTILNVAGGTIGYIGNHSITLAKMQTMVGSYVQIVNIAGNAVVVVIYNGHYLPYYLNPGVGQWIPVLGISSVGGYMNTYPQNPTGISVVDSIAGILNQKLPGRLVGQFVGANSAGVQFPTPAPAAYQTINAEFPNGVVQSATEMQSQTGQQLYNNNYNRIKNIFITAHLGGFFIDYFIL